jgi:UDP-N-acetylglucosamine 2-epimerase
MKKLRVMTVVGTRPEVIRLSRIIPKLDRYCSHTLVHTGQNYDYELNEIFFKDLGLRPPDRQLHVADPSQTASVAIAKIISSIDRLLQEYQPDAFLVLGDTNSGLSVIPAKRRKIPIFHMEAGNRCFDSRVPEEINRKIIDHTSDINLAYSDIARECLLHEGLPRDLVIKIGSPLREVITHYRPKIESSRILELLKLSKNNYFVASLHREENVDSHLRFRQLVSTLNAMCELYDSPVVFPAHPRSRLRAQELGLRFSERVLIIKPLNFTDYLQLQLNARAVLSDSGSISEESSILNLRALNLRETTERHEATEEGSPIMVDLTIESVSLALSILQNQSLDTSSVICPVTDYGSENVSEKVLRIIHSYVGYVNRVIWRTP